MEGYDLWLNSGNPLDEESYNEHIDDCHDGVCPICEETTENKCHEQCLIDDVGGWD